MYGADKNSSPKCKFLKTVPPHFSVLKKIYLPLVDGCECWRGYRLHSWVLNVMSRNCLCFLAAEMIAMIEILEAEVDHVLVGVGRHEHGLLSDFRFR